MKNEELAMKILDRKNTIDSLIHKNYHNLSQKLGLSLDQFHLLLELDELNIDLENELSAPTIGTLAKNINVSQNTVSERITRLEKKGLVKRIADSKDRRISHVVLTDSGINLLKNIGSKAETEFVKSALLNLKNNELENLLLYYDKLIAKMEEK